MEVDGHRTEGEAAQGLEASDACGCTSTGDPSHEESLRRLAEALRRLPPEDCARLAALLTQPERASRDRHG